MMTSIAERLIDSGRGSGLRAQIIRGATGVGGLKLLFLSLTLGTSILLARALGPEGFGQYAFITSLLMVVALPLDQGMRNLITREVASYDHQNQWPLFRGLLHRAHQWVLLGAALIILVLGGIAVFRAEWRLDDRWTLLLAGLAMLPFLGLNALRGATLAGLGNVVKAQIPELLVRPGMHLAIAALLLAGGRLNPASAIISQTAAAVIAFAVGILLLRKHWPAQAQGITRAYRDRAWASAWAPFTLLAAAGMLNSQIGILLLGWLGTDAQVAALRIADRGAQLVAMSLMVVNLVIAPHITRAYRDGDQRRLQRLCTQSARAALAVALPIALPLILFSEPIIDYVFGTEYVALSSTPLAVLAAAQVVNVAFGSVGMFLIMSGHERDTLTGQTIALFLNIAAAYLLIPSYGADGAAYAAAIGLITWNIILAFKLVQRLRIRPAIF